MGTPGPEPPELLAIDEGRLALTVPDGADAETELLCDLLQSQILEEAQVPDLSKLLRELVQGCRHGIRLLPHACHTTRRGSRNWTCEDAPGIARGLSLECREGLRPVLSSSPARCRSGGQVPDPVLADLQEPASERSLSFPLEACTIPPGMQQGLLPDILSRQVAAQSCAQPALDGHQNRCRPHRFDKTIPAAWIVGEQRVLG